MPAGLLDSTSSPTGLCFLLAINLIETVEWDVSQDRVEISFMARSRG